MKKIIKIIAVSLILLWGISYLSISSNFKIIVYRNIKIINETGTGFNIKIIDNYGDSKNKIVESNSSYNLYIGDTINTNVTDFILLNNDYIYYKELMSNMLIDDIKEYDGYNIKYLEEKFNTIEKYLPIYQKSLIVNKKFEIIVK